jgi:hypothetical protein
MQGVLVYPPSKRPVHTVEQVDSDNDDDDDDRDSIEYLLNNTTIKSIGVSHENEDNDDEDGQHSVFNYALNESVIVEHILDSCRNFKRFGRPDLLSKSENHKVGFYDFENCCTYRGSFFNDKPQGIGIIELRNGQVFFGHFIRGVKVDNKFH